MLVATILVHFTGPGQLRSLGPFVPSVFREWISRERERDATR